MFTLTTYQFVVWSIFFALIFLFLWAMVWKMFKRCQAAELRERNHIQAIFLLEERIKAFSRLATDKELSDEVLAGHISRQRKNSFLYSLLPDEVRKRIEDHDYRIQDAGVDGGELTSSEIEALRTYQKKLAAVV